MVLMGRVKLEKDVDMIACHLHRCLEDLFECKSEYNDKKRTLREDVEILALAIQVLEGLEVLKEKGVEVMSEDFPCNVELV